MIYTGENIIIPSCHTPRVNRNRWPCFETSTEICGIIAVIQTTKCNAKEFYCAAMRAQQLDGITPARSPHGNKMSVKSSFISNHLQTKSAPFIPLPNLIERLDGLCTHQQKVEYVDNRCSISSQIPRLVMDVERGFHMYMLWYLLWLMDCVWALTRLSSNKIKLNFHLMKSLTFSIVFSQKNY